MRNNEQSPIPAMTTMLLANSFGFAAAEPLKIEDPAVREVPKVSFS